MQTLENIPTAQLQTELLQRACARHAQEIMRLELQLEQMRAKQNRRLRQLALDLTAPNLAGAARASKLDVGRSMFDVPLPPGPLPLTDPPSPQSGRVTP